jgi:hypothetical protein
MVVAASGAAGSGYYSLTTAYYVARVGTLQPCICARKQNLIPSFVLFSKILAYRYFLRTSLAKHKNCAAQRSPF